MEYSLIQNYRNTAQMPQISLFNVNWKILAFWNRLHLSKYFQWNDSIGVTN